MAQNITRRRAMLAGTAALIASAPFAAPALAASGDSGPDADLIRLCAEHIANWHAYNTSDSDLEAEDDPLWHAYWRTHIAIDDARPQSIDGILAKARAAKTEAHRPDGTEERDGGQGAVWAWDLVNDLLRLNGGGLNMASERSRRPGWPDPIGWN